MKLLIILAYLILPIGQPQNQSNMSANQFELVQVDDGLIKKYSLDDLNGPIYVRRGRKFMLELKANPTTGYQWFFEEEPAGAIAFISKKYKASEKKSDNPMMGGGGGHEYWKFKAKSKGSYPIKLKYSRSATSTDEPKVFNVIVLGLFQSKPKEKKVEKTKSKKNNL